MAVACVVCEKVSKEERERARRERARARVRECACTVQYAERVLNVRALYVCVYAHVCTRVNVCLCVCLRAPSIHRPSPNVLGWGESEDLLARVEVNHRFLGGCVGMLVGTQVVGSSY